MLRRREKGGVASSATTRGDMCKSYTIATIILAQPENGQHHRVPHGILPRNHVLHDSFGARSNKWRAKQKHDIFGSIQIRVEFNPKRKGERTSNGHLSADVAQQDKQT